MRRMKKFACAALAAATLLTSSSVAVLGAQTDSSVGNVWPGDANLDWVVTIDDATIIQKYLAQDAATVAKYESREYSLGASDYNRDQVVDITDVTGVQMEVAELYPTPDPDPDPDPDPTPDENVYTIDNIRDYVVGLDQLVTLEDGTQKQLVNFDNAATTPALQPVMDEINKELLMYGSIGRGFSQKSNHSTDVYNSVRKKVLSFVNASEKAYTCFFVNNTTDGMNKLASALIENENDVVLTTRMEHHANDLPWRERCRVIYSEIDENGRIDYEDMERQLRENRVKYVSVTAASNVTGYVTDLHRVAKLAHRYNAKIVVDGAQIVAHRAVNMGSGNSYTDIDFLVFSAHKMYSPYGGGAVVGRTDVLNQHMPEFYGGGTVKIVGDYNVRYKSAPEAYEAGSPNYPGIVGLGKAIDVLTQVGFEDIQAHEKKLNQRLIDGLKKYDNAVIYGDSVNIDDRVGVVTFNFKDANSYLLAQKLSELGAIATRQGAFCAHPYVWRLMHIPDDSLDQFTDCTSMNTPGMIRVSFGIYNTEEEVDELLRMIPIAHAAATSPEEMQKHGNVRIYY